MAILLLGGNGCSCLSLFKVNDPSKNLLPLDFLMMGESYHNNHHKYSGSPNFGGVRWHEIDPTYYIMKGLHFLKLIRLKPFTGTVKRDQI